MNFDFWLPLLILLSSLVPGMMIFFLPEERYGLRTFLNMAGATLKILLMVIIVVGVYREHVYETRLPLLPDMDLVLHADAMSLMLATLSTALWFLTTLYAIGYLEGTHHRSRFFGFFSLCVTSTIGVALAGNMITFLLFYEMLTLSTYPLITHRGTDESMKAGRIYLVYTLTGGMVLLAAVAWLRALVGTLDFTEGGMLAAAEGLHRKQVVIIFVLMVAGLGVKAALVPLHGWLPIAMVAPAPVSALLHAVAVVKAGAFGIVRVVYDVYGVRFVAQQGLLMPLAVTASVTIVYGSVRALFEDELKKRLAYSTVSQVSYILLGSAIFGPAAMAGGMAHLVHQGLMKITLFFCAGNVAETLGIRYVSEMDGVGRRMPWTMAAFTLGALGMIGVPPMAGFISKWQLGIGGLSAGHTWVLLVLAVSSLLNAAYFLPIVYKGWFKEPVGPWTEKRIHSRFEAPWTLLLPPLITATLALLAGLLAGAPYSPLTWARLIVAREYAP